MVPGNQIHNRIEPGLAGKPLVVLRDEGITLEREGQGWRPMTLLPTPLEKTDFTTEKDSMVSSITKTEASLSRVFGDGFVARDLAEPLVSYDIHTDPEIVRRHRACRPRPVFGVRTDGLIGGFLDLERMDNRPLIEQMQSLENARVVEIETAFQEIVQGLNVNSFLLVATLGEPVGVITRNDVEKPPMRMWLFGMVSLFEMMITRIVGEHYKNDSWVQFVSKSRLAKARELQNERSRRNQAVELMDCLQLGDKGQLFARSIELRARFWDQSRNRIEKAVKNLERLRNNLAHSQPVITENWETIVMLSEAMDALFEVQGKLEQQRDDLIE